VRLAGALGATPVFAGRGANLDALVSNDVRMFFVSGRVASPTPRELRVTHSA
jgi:hypothetical protein